jgi:asparagine synthase (glutamine-hydrolysing)
VKTFSIGFQEGSFDELEHARVVAQHFATDHHEFVVEAKAAELLQDLVWNLDEPFADASALPTYILAGLAREHVTVVLTGDGGDEAFAGYDSYRAERWLGGYRSVPAPLRKALERLLRNRREHSSRTAIMRRAKRFVEKADMPFERREWRMMFPHAVKYNIYSPEFAASVGERDSLDLRAEAFRTWEGLDPVQQLQLWDLTVYLPDDLMVKTDRTAMAHGLEARCPLLDHVLIERCARLRSNLKVRGMNTKYIFKKAVADLLPPSIVSRPKQGFGVPVSHWFRTELRELAHDVLLSADSLQRGYFRAGALRDLLKAHERGGADHGHKLWALVMLELWHRRFAPAGVAPAPDLALVGGP